VNQMAIAARKWRRINHLVGRLAHCRHLELQHIFSESISQIRNNTPYLELEQFEKYKQLGKEVIGNRDCIIADIGGYDGGFARSLSRFVTRRIISFEPSVSQSESLKACAFELPHFEYYPIALGSKPEIATFYEQSSGSLSSLHRMHRAAYEATQLRASYDVTVSTLDNEVARLGISKPMFLKVDTQGHDLDVLRGAEGLLSHGMVFALMIEMVTREKYEGQPLMLDVMAYLQSRGFVLYDFWPIYREPDGAVSEFDAVLVQR
jgi:FkbM family methyltransferase